MRPIHRHDPKAYQCTNHQNYSTPGAKLGRHFSCKTASYTSRSACTASCTRQPFHRRSPPFAQASRGGKATPPPIKKKKRFPAVGGISRYSPGDTAPTHCFLLKNKHADPFGRLYQHLNPGYWIPPTMGPRRQ